MINTKKIETTFPPEPFVTAEQEKQVSKNTKDFILNRVAGYFKKPFFQSVATVTIGTIFAQTISAAFSPLITRLYGPEAFGILGVFITITNILIPLATLTYSVSIVLPAQDRDAKDLVRLSFLTALTVAFVCALVLFFSQNIIVNLLQIRTIEKFLYLVPIVLFFSACTQIIQQWMIRKKQYKTNATIDVISSLSINTAKAGGGLLWPFSSTLIILSAFGHFLSAMLMSFGAKKTFDFSSFSLMPTQGTLSRLKDIAKRYSDFPIFRAPQIFLNSVSLGLPVLLLTSLFSPAAAGFYVLGKNILTLPAQFLSKSFGDVFYPRIAEAGNRGENISRLIIHATLGLMAVGIIPFGLIAIFGPRLFTLVFGNEWTMAGQYARWLALWTFLAFLNKPSVLSILVLKLQGFLLAFEIVSITLRTAALFLGYMFCKSDIAAVASFCIAGAILNIALILYVISKSTKVQQLINISDSEVADRNNL